MNSKRFNKITALIIIVLLLSFGGCLIYSKFNTEFSFINTLSALSSFFVAVLTAMYVYTTSNQMDIMKMQLKQMQQEQQLREQPILEISSSEFKIERPRFYYTPPTNEYSYLSRYFYFFKIHNNSTYPAIFIDISAELVVTENGKELVLGATSERINTLAANNVSETFSVMFTGDQPFKLMTALRGYSTLDLPRIKVTICYKSLSGANLLLEHTYWLDVSSCEEENIQLLKNWHSNLTSVFTAEKEQLDRLKNSLNQKENDKLFDLMKESFDQRLMGEEFLLIDMIEIPEEFSLKAISKDEFDSIVGKHGYGHYIGNHVKKVECKNKTI